MPDDIKRTETNGTVTIDQNLTLTGSGSKVIVTNQKQQPISKVRK